MPADMDALTKKLDGSTATITREIEAARKEVEDASSAIRRLEDDKKRLQSEIQAINSRRQSLPADTALQSQQRELEKNLAAGDAKLIDQTKALAALVGDAKDKKAEERLEGARSTFLVEAKALLDSLTDGPVRYLCAAALLRSCDERHITVEAFTRLTDKAAAQQIIAQVNAVRIDTSPADREQATWFEDAGKLIGELSAARARDANERQELAQRMKSLSHEHDDLVAQIAQLEAPEPPEAAKRRHLKATVCAVSGFAVLAVGALALIAGLMGSIGGAAAPVGIVALIGAIVLLIVARVNSDAHRAAKLKSLHARRESDASKLKAIEDDAPARVQRVRAEADRFVTALVKLKISPPTAPDDARPFDSSLNAAEQRMASWRSAHSEISSVVH